MGDRLGTLGAVGFSFPLFISRLFAISRTTLAASKPQWEASLSNPLLPRGTLRRTFAAASMPFAIRIAAVSAENRSRRPRAPKAKSD